MLVWNTASGGPAPGNIKYVDFDGQATNWGFAENSGTIFRACQRGRGRSLLAQQPISRHAGVWCQSACSRKLFLSRDNADLFQRGQEPACQPPPSHAKRRLSLPRMMSITLSSGLTPTVMASQISRGPAQRQHQQRPSEHCSFSRIRHPDTCPALPSSLENHGHRYGNGRASIIVTEVWIYQRQRPLFRINRRLRLRNRLSRQQRQRNSRQRRNRRLRHHRLLRRQQRRHPRHRRHQYHHQWLRRIHPEFSTRWQRRDPHGPPLWICRDQ